ncbi:hypothetical protein V2P20_04565 [Methylobacter sp. Wu1]|uniref:hypothetical protein n=1 Tax=Methylobacter sp. Wu1 TaxID=3119359 RepID=UPI002F947DD7
MPDYFRLKTFLLAFPALQAANKIPYSGCQKDLCRKITPYCILNNKIQPSVRHQNIIKDRQSFNQQITGFLNDNNHKTLPLYFLPKNDQAELAGQKTRPAPGFPPDHNDATDVSARCLRSIAILE